MKTTFTTRFALFLALAFVALLLTFAVSAAPAAQEGISDRPLPGLSQDLDHYSGDAIPLDGAAEDPLPQVPQQIDTVPWSKMVYQAVQDNTHWEIWIANGNGTDSVRLTYGDSYNIHPRLNRGANRIVYSSNFDENFDIYTMDTLGNNVVRLTNNSQDDVNPDWSPDGSKVVFESYRDGQPEIYVMNADGSGQTRLTNSGDFDGMPVWAPGGQKIAFVSRRTGGYRIYTISPTGTNLTQLSNQPVSVYPAWSPDGSQIAYSADQDGDGFLELWRMNSDGSTPQQLYDPGTQVDAWAHSWSADGRHIGYTRISFIFYQGNWYWTYAYLYGWDSSNGSTNQLLYGDVHWHPGWQTMDTQKPVSSMSSLPAQSPARVPLNWSGFDQGPAGIRNFDIQVKDGANGSWVNWLTTPNTSDQYAGTGGHTYYFRIRARDNGLNLEDWPASYDATTTIEALPPVSAVQPLPAYSQVGTTLIRWGGNDPGGSGIFTYDVQYRDSSNNNWVDWQMATSLTSASFTGTAGHTYYFRARSVDNAFNVENWSAGDGDTSTTLYTWALNGRAFDHAGVPIAGAIANTTPAALAALPSDLFGRYASYIATAAETYRAVWGKPGYGELPDTDFIATQPGSFDAFLPPRNNLLLNWGFEEGDFTPADWQISGPYTPIVTDSQHHSGDYAAILGPASLFNLPIPVSTDIPYSDFPSVAVSSDGIIHIAWRGGANGIYYSRRATNGSWSDPLHISGNTMWGAAPRLMLDQQGVLHIVWWAHQPDPFNYDSLYYAKRNSNGTWSAPQLISADLSIASTEDFATQMDANGVIHVVLSHSVGTAIYYLQRSINGNWSVPVIVDNTYSKRPQLAVADNGIVHVVWEEGEFYTNDVYYAHRNPNGTWTAGQNLTQGLANRTFLTLIADHTNRVHLFWKESGEPDALYYTLLNGQTWSTPQPLHAVEWLPFPPQLAVDDNNTLHVTWGDLQIYYLRRTANGTWSSLQIPSGNSSNAQSPHLALDDNDMVHLVWSNVVYDDDGSYGQVYYSQRNTNGSWTVPQFVSQGLAYSHRPLVIPAAGGPVHFVWYDGGSAAGHDIIYHTTRAIAGQTADSAISQQVTIPLTVSNPSLSFLYQLDGAAANSGLEVRVHDGQSTTTLFTSHDNTNSWQHAWLDLNPWAGETITVSLNAHQSAGSFVSHAYLDEVTLGSSYPDVWLATNSLTTGLPGQQVVLTFAYGNRGAAIANDVVISYTLPAGLTFVAANIPPSATSPALIWNVGDLPARSEPFIIQVTALVAPSNPLYTNLVSVVEIESGSTELETLNNSIEIATFIGRILFLPIVNR